MAYQRKTPPKENAPKRIYIKRATPLLDKHKEINPNDYILKLLRIYNKHLESGMDNVTSICNFSGLTQLALSHRNPHPSIAAIIATPESKRLQGDKDALAAYGYEILMGNV